MPESVWDWSRWPARSLDEVQGMFIDSILGCVRRMEDRRITPIEIHLGAGSSNFWRTRHRRSREREFSHSNVGEVDRLFGMTVVHNSSLDRTLRTSGDFESEVRLVSEGYGSEAVRMVGQDHPDRLSYLVEFRGPLSDRRSRSFSYSTFEREAGFAPGFAPGIVAPPSRPTRGSMDDIARVRGILNDRMNAPVQAKAIQKPKMSDLMIAWNT